MRNGLLIVVALLACAMTAPAAIGAVSVSPLPGTPDASPQTQISILGAPIKAITRVTVTGSQSGRHPGRLRPYSRDRGASFVLGTPLIQGERVEVVVAITSKRLIRQSFTVAHVGALQQPLNLPITQPAKLDHFLTLPGLEAPRITVHRRGRAARAGGDIFLAPLPSPIIHPGASNVLSIHPVGPGGPMIITPGGRLIWFDQLTPPNVAANFRIQRFEGHRVLTWWQGGVTPSAYGLGEGVIADHSYRALRTVRTGNGYAADIHEFVLTPAGDALFTIESPVLVHLAGTPAPQLSPLLDSIVQEVDVRTGLVEWEWHSYGHIPLVDSYATPGNSTTFDAYHINSIQPLAGERMLISARDTCAIYELSAASGRIDWTLGGKDSSFSLGRGARFWFQHDAQLLPGARVSLFDDEGGPPIKARTSRGLILGVDLRHRRASVVRQFTRSQPTLAESEGSVQGLPGDQVFLGFGSTGFFSQLSATGRLDYDAQLPSDDGSYRVYRFPWSATPRTRPTVLARRTAHNRTAVAVSWNGATAVARWQVIGADSARVLATAPDRAFETRITVRSRAPALRVRALDGHGRIVATSGSMSVS